MAKKAKAPAREPATGRGLYRESIYLHADELAAVEEYAKRKRCSKAEAIRRAVDGVGLEGPLPSDPDWTRQRTPVLDALRAPRTVRAGASLAWHRLRSLS